MKVQDLISAKKDAGVETVRPDATISEAAEKLRQKGIGAMVVSVTGRPPGSNCPAATTRHDSGRGAYRRCLAVG